MKISIITPCFNETENINLFYEELTKTMDQVEDLLWEWIIVDDHSAKETTEIIESLCRRQSNVKLLRLAKNSGSHIAALCGIQNCYSDFAVVMAVDLQDHPSYIRDLLNNCQDVAVVWATRTNAYRREKFIHNVLSKLYYRILFFLLGKDVHMNGADLFLINRNVINEIRKINYADVNIIDLVHNLGFESKSIPYEKTHRRHGKSKWTFARKVSLFINSIVLNSALPLRLLGLVGVAVSLAGFYFAILVALAYYEGNPYPGWSSLIVATLGIGGLILINLSIIGEYLWRVLKNSKSLPIYSVEKKINLEE